MNETRGEAESPDKQIDNLLKANMGLAEKLAEYRRVGTVEDFRGLLKLQPPSRIEAAIKKLEEDFDRMKRLQGHPWGSYHELSRNINLLKFVLNQPQEEKGYPGSIWTDKELGLEFEGVKEEK